MTRASENLEAVIRWFVARRGAKRCTPFYCDPASVGVFAVPVDDLAAGGEEALFQLFVALSMYQALRDVVVMRHQRALSRGAVSTVADARFLKRSIGAHQCGALASAEVFDQACDVFKGGGTTDCDRCPGVACHVKDATIIFRRMGDMGKLPTSAWLRFWKRGIGTTLQEVHDVEMSPTARAAILVGRLAKVHRVGRKLGTMFVSALSTPALAPGLTPWFPEVDGNDLVVVDTNVARAVDALRSPGSSKSYDERARWVRQQAALIDLRRFRPELPCYSPRLVQEALYAYCSKSNRLAHGDECVSASMPCSGCAPALCPFHDRRVASDRSSPRDASLTPGTS